MSIESKTKEQIVKEHYERVFSSPPYEKSVNREMNMSYFGPAMEQYARSRAIEFSDWKDKNCKIVMECKEDGDIIWQVDGIEDKGFRLPQLYELFSQQIDNHSIDK